MLQVEINFNHIISQTRQPIERAFALLKGRFRRLKFLHMSRIDLIPATILACCVLHNICLNYEDNDIDNYIEAGIVINEQNREDGEEDENIIVNNEGVAKRNYLSALLYKG